MLSAKIYHVRFIHDLCKFFLNAVALNQYTNLTQNIPGFVIFEKRKNMKTILLNIPDSLDLNDREAKMLLASRLYEKGRLTLGQGAEMVGLSKSTFMELLVDYDVPVINHKLSDLDSDINNAKNYSI